MSRKKLTASDFGKDHWSLLGYIETLCVDSHLGGGVGQIDKRRVRANEKRHPLHAVNVGLADIKWKDEYGTRLSGFFLEGDKRDSSRQIPWHDDWDCLDDLEDLGFVEILSTAVGTVKMTDKGHAVAGRLREWKAKGGYFATFKYEEPATAGK